MSSEITEIEEITPLTSSDSGPKKFSSILLFAVIFLFSFAVFGIYFCTDITSIETKISEELGFSKLAFDAFSSSYYWLVIFSSMIGGSLLDTHLPFTSQRASDFYGNLYCWPVDNNTGRMVENIFLYVCWKNYFWNWF